MRLRNGKVLAAALTLLGETWWVALRCLGKWREARKTRRSVAGNCSVGYANGCGFPVPGDAGVASFR